MAAINKEPLIRISKRATMPGWKGWLIRCGGLLLALVICGIIIFSLTKLNPVAVYKAMFEGAFGTEVRAWVTIRDIMMLLCIALGLAPAFKMRFWNIGAEGQILMGGIVSAACMIYLSKSIPLIPLLIMMFVMAAIAGGIWGFIPAVFKAKWNANETLFTLMMNYIAIQLTSFFVSKWENPPGSNTVGVINQMTKGGWFPEIWGQKYTLNVIIVLTLAVIMYFYLKNSKQGYEIAVVGESENTARYAGISVKKVIIRTMLISGALCGIAGFIAVSGASHTISTSTAGGKGFIAIIAAWLGKFNPAIMLVFSTLIVFLEQGALEIASKFGLNDFVSQMITGIILFCILGSEFFINYKVNFKKNEKEATK